MAQTWEDLLFAHWAVDMELVRPHVPEQLDVDVFDGKAWLGITPFRISGLRLRGTLPIPRLSTFPEINVRTYVAAGGKAGIWFFSLDTSSRAAAEAARFTYKLPYFRADMSEGWRGGWLDYSSTRTSGGHRASFAARYRPAGEPNPAAPGSLEYFLAERYCLYALDEGRLHRAEIHHPPWPLQAAEAEIETNSMPPPGLELPDEAPLLHFSARQDVLIWPLERVAET